MKLLTLPSSGSQASTVFSHNRAGQYTRYRATPTNTVGSGRRATVRGYLGTASAAWNTATDAQRAGWMEAAAERPRVNSLGKAVWLSGQQLFVAINAQRLNIGASVSADVPSDWEVWRAFDVAPNISLSVGRLAVGWSGGVSGAKALIGVSVQYAAGVTYNGRWWQVAVVAATEGYKSFYSAYSAEYGSPTLGKRVFMKVTPVSALGVTGAPAVVSGILVA